MRKRVLLIVWLISLGLTLTMGGRLAAMPPYPGTLERIQSGEIKEPYALSHQKELRLQGVDAPQNSALRINAMSKTGSPRTTSSNVLCVLVDFSDKPATTNAAFFDTLMFFNRTGTVRNYFREVSYDAFDLVTVNLPSAIGWKRAPQTYAYYCGDYNGCGTYPQNSQKLVEDIITLIDPIVDFSQYDNNGDGWIEGLVIVHTGSGAELTGSSNDIWSHQWGITPVRKDGKWISTYSIQPEYWYSPTPGDMTCGVFAHELGHALFGLPDLYDTDYTSRGVGQWSLMAAGSWNGSLGSSPAHLDAWSRIQCGFATATNIESNVNNQTIPNVESSATGAIFRLWSSGILGNQYFLIENRRKTGYDTFLPSQGLLIWHIDEGVATNNDKEWHPGHTSDGHYLVALEQADNLYQLEQNVSDGNAGDPFPGTSNSTSFSKLTSPSTNDYNGTNTLASVTGISASAPIMTANLSVSLAADVDDNTYTNNVPQDFVLAQNFPNPFNPQTRISFDLPKSSRVRLSVYNVLGEKIEDLINDVLPAGTHSLDWVPQGKNTQQLPSGIYFYQLVTDEVSLSRKMLLLK
jgi:immune inhibitor A